MDFDKVLQDDIFKSIEPEKIDAIKSFVQESEGKSVQDVMLLMLKYNKALNLGRKISKEEREAMLNVIFKNINEKEKEQFKSIIKIIEMSNNN